MHISSPRTIAALTVVFVAVAPFSSMAQRSNNQVESIHSVAPVDLGSAANFTILSKAGISNTGDSTILGHLGVSPIAGTAVTGFGLQLDSQGRFSTSSLVTGRVYAADYDAPTPSMLTTAIGDMHTAYLDAAGRQNPRATELGAGNIGGRTIRQGLYKWSSNVIIPDDVILSGGINSVWIFQIAGTLTVGAGTRIVLQDGAQAKNVFWQVGGATTIRTTAVFNGNILGKTKIVLMTGARLNGRALAHTAVTLDANTIKKNSTSEATRTSQPFSLELLSTPVAREGHRP
jgi:hypothetical protein